MGQDANWLEAVLRHDRWLLVGGLVAILAMAWGWLLAGAGMAMSAVEMTRMAGMDGWLMQPAVWTASYAALIFAMWWVMMVAMMLPSAAPVLLLYGRIHRGRHTARAPLGLTALFGAGYLIAWGLFSAAATVLQWGLETTRLLSPMLELSNRWLGAAILMAAGCWQLTPLKIYCLEHCRTPLNFLLGHWRSGPIGALTMGLEHGAFCLGCCWFLMTLLFFGGAMNLFWIIGLTVFVLLEKTLTHGLWLARMAGVALLGSGLLLVFRGQ